MKYQKKQNDSLTLFIKSAIYTASALILFFIGYFAAKFFFGH